MKVNVNSILNVYTKRSLPSAIVCGEISIMDLFMVTAGLANIYAITTFGPKLSLQNKIKVTKAKMKEMMLAHNNQVIS
ncbi:MAG: hypothetical protein ACJ71G_08325 [Nitrososphaeraceae archaeon]